MVSAQPKSIALIQGHPDPDPGHLCRGLADAYEGAARDAGHAVTVIDVAQLDFPMLRSPAEFDEAPVPPGLVAAQKAILAADHLVVVFPLWLGTLPALTKGFFEQALHRKDWFDTGNGSGWPKGRLKGKSARIVATMGMPAPVFRIWFGGHGTKSFERSILAVVGVRPIRETLFGMVEAASPERRAKWLETMRTLGEKGG
ncbi:NAD(P)H-dependent oxidoreductase [Amorphus orientalis]|uniref:NADPH-quinone reductase n=1 Tax=Amorphus orientalis TaxID=649198 RepID=A0AAE4AU44_9HYPH|nr:NAD(P)H-dependent oxidoreductase [Amorphus orientalis]MDQ0316935.1 putative NADPH-quinone reductase [Amorphus orientalis]